MATIFGSLSAAAGVNFWLDVGAKATALLLAAIAAAALLSRSSAALRHRVWSLTFAALLLLPGLSAALPKWRLAVLPVAAEENGAAAALVEAPQQPPGDRSVENVAPAEQTFFEPPAVRGELMPDAAAPPSLPLAATEPVAAANAQPLTAQAARLPGPATIWLLGAGLALSPLAIGLIRMFELRRESRTVESAAWIELVNDVRARLGLARRVDLLETDAAVMPMTWGLLRPAVLLPSQARQWSERLRRIVLLHELAHVKRCDVGFQLLGRLTCALYWFHPLAWYALRRLRIERELACDDCVVHTGELASDYAAELLEIAHTYQPVRLAAAIAMAQRSSLEHRIRSLFDRACSHLPLSGRAARLLLASVTILVPAIAGIRLAPRAAAEVDDKGAAAETPQPEDDLVTVTGRVVDPQGKPAAGAKVFAVRWYWEPHIPHPPLAETKTGADGRFTISYRKSQFAINVARPDQWKETAIVATVADFGAGWVNWMNIPAGKDAVLRLVPDDAPITGRVVDLEGNPVPDVSVQVGYIAAGKSGSLDGWLAAVRAGEFPWTAARHFDDDMLPHFDAWPPRAVTGSDGRFRIDGIGRERKVELSFVGETIAYQRAAVVTRKSETLRLKISTMSDESTPVFGADFELVAPPSQPIIGVVRDAATRRPLAGVSIESNKFAGSNYANERHLLAISDAQGRYRLVGMPKGAGNQLLAVPNDEQPYLMREVDVPEASGLEPVEVDIELHRGVWITGRVTDRKTGEPLIAWLHYLPFISNEYARQTPEFGTPPGSADGYENRYVSRPDGSFRLVGLPGRAIVGALCLTGHYRAGLGAEVIEGMDHRGNFDTYPNPVMPGKKWPHAMKEINPAADAKSVVCDLALDPGGKITVNVFDREGKPVSGFETEGSGQSSFGSTSERASFHVISLGPDETRTVIIRHKERQLGKVLRLRTTDATSGFVSATLEPLSKFTGRLTDAEGAPLSGATITAFVHPLTDFPRQLPGISTDDEGRFEYPDVPVGCRYILDAQAADIGRPGWFAEDVAIEPGETKDLGDVIYGSAVRGKSKPKANAETEIGATTPTGAPDANATDAATSPPSDQSGVLTLRGRVLLPDGKPAAKAELYWARIESTEPGSRMIITKRGATDGEGRFQIPLAQSDLPATAVPLSLVAHKSGFGVAWRQIARGQASPDITLRLVEDRPIRGRVTDTEGRPVAGARVVVGNVLNSRDGNLDSFLTAWKQNWRDSWMKLDRAGGLNPAPASMGAVTDEGGRFQLSGVGVERVASVEIAAAGYAYDQLHVVNRDGFDASRYNKAALSQGVPPTPNRGMEHQLTGPTFQHVVEAELVIRGKVFTGATRTPVAGASIRCAGVSAVTDAAGRYELHGHPRNRPVWLGVYAPAPSELLDRWLRRDVAPTEAALDIDVELKRGVVVTGRVFDRATGKGVAAGIRFVLLPDDGFVDQADHAQDAVTATDVDTGQFRLLVMPGPGVLMAQAHGGGPRIDGEEINPYRQASFSQEESKRVPTTFDGDDRYFTGRDNTLNFLMDENAVKVIDVAPNGKPVTCDLPLDRGKTAKIAIEDERGQPVSDAFVSGLADCWPYTFRIAEPTCTVYGLGPDRPRRVCILHPERRLAGSVTLTGEENRPLKVRLAAPARITGHALAPDGQPLADALVQINYVRRSAKELLRFVELEAAPLKTDRDGRFHVENIVPGERFALDFKQGDTFFSAPLVSEQRDSNGGPPQFAQWIQRMIGLADERRELTVGQQLELGDVKVK